MVACLIKSWLPGNTKNWKKGGKYSKALNCSFHLSSGFLESKRLFLVFLSEISWAMEPHQKGHLRKEWVKDSFIDLAILEKKAEGEWRDYWPSDVALAQVFVGCGLFDEELHLCGHIQRVIVGKVSSCI